MSKILFFNFDGTCNDPGDGVQEKKRITGDFEDRNITNILKFHLLLGGDPKNGKTDLPGGSKSFYYRGVGTYGNFLEKKRNAIFGSKNYDVKNIRLDAMEDFLNNYDEQVEKIIITGFSRGGAIARKFAYTINGAVPRDKMIIAIFDSVARIAGDEDEGEKIDYSFDIEFNDITVASNIEKALHIVSLDERRVKFTPTLMNHEEKVTEIWFAGGHSDIGGGYRQDGLSDVTLSFLMDWIEDLDLGISFKNPDDIDYAGLRYDDEESLGSIDRFDLEIDPDPFDVRHQAKLPPKRSDREFLVMVGDRASFISPLVHHSVIERIDSVRSYWPLLKGKKYRVYYDDEKIVERTGFTKRAGYIDEDTILLKEGNPTATATIRARKRYNHTGIRLERGKRYRIKVIEEGTWADSSIGGRDDRSLTGRDVRNGIGWDRKGIKHGFIKESLYLANEWRRRVDRDGAKWFTLCGTIGEDDGKAFVIGSECEYVAEYTGELCAFANDLPGRYGNNSGKLKIRVTLL